MQFVCRGIDIELNSLNSLLFFLSLELFQLTVENNQAFFGFGFSFTTVLYSNWKPHYSCF